MSNEIKINSNGGSVSIGTVVQGDRNQIGNTVSVRTIDLALEHARAEVAKLAPPGTHLAEAVRLVTEQLSALGEEAKQPDPSTESATSILKTLRENFSWAYPAVKDFAKAVWPALLSLV
jgi:hypothetical protein